MNETIISHITPAKGNVFLDLGFAPDEAARLKAEADAKIDEERAQLSCERSTKSRFEFLP